MMKEKTNIVLINKTNYWREHTHTIRHPVQVYILYTTLRIGNIFEIENHKTCTEFIKDHKKIILNLYSVIKYALFNLLCLLRYQERAHRGKNEGVMSPPMAFSI